MASTAIVIKKRFLDNANNNEPVEPGTPLKVSADRAKYLVEHGFAAYSGTQEAEVVKEETGKKK